MAAPAILKLEILADASKATAALDKTERAAGGAGTKLGTLAKAAAGAFVFTKAVQFGKASVQAATEAAVATERLDAVFAQAGDTTGKASKAAQDYAAALSKKIGVDDEVIMAGQAQLATFHAVSDETARAAGVFDRATVAAADLAAAGFGSIEGNSVSLGKALQDPTKGLAKLTKQGVNFSDAQKEQITAMQKSGDLLGAQKLILAGVEGQVKGTAEATVTSQDKMNVAFGETQEAVGGALLPVLEQLAPILQQVATFVQQNTSWLIPLVAAIASAVAIIKVINIVTAIWNTTLLANPITWIVVGIVALIAIIVVLVKNWDKVTAAFQFVWSWLKKNWPLLLAILTGPIGAAVLLIVKNWDTIKSAIAGVFDWIKGAATSVWRWVTDKFHAIADAISDAFSNVAAVIKAPINAILRGWNNLRFPSKTFDTGAAGFLPGVPDSITIGGWNLPNIPLLAQGGTVMRTGLALVHAGEQFSGVGKTFGGGGATVVNIHVAAAGLGADAPEIQRAVVKALRGFTSRNGPLDVPIRSAG